ncbi:Uncharacterized protein Rs2_29432 [Raphanus sativus]|nr:Uncharacterized protein Rs2_29432 [Raphanus sativus]
MGSHHFFLSLIRIFSIVYSRRQLVSIGKRLGSTCVNPETGVAQLLAGFDENLVAQGIDNEIRIMEDELRKVLADIFVENAKLRKQVNSAMVRALQKDVETTATKDVNEENKKEDASIETLKV